MLSETERFWKYVKKTDGCWEWQGTRANGYGIFAVNGKNRYAHRYSWELHNGPITQTFDILIRCTDGRPGYDVGQRLCYVCHHCDNPPCVRPDHLFLGSAKDNSEDAERKGRTTQRNTPLRKLSDAEVRMIRTIASYDHTIGELTWTTRYRDIANLFGITPEYAAHVARGLARKKV